MKDHEAPKSQETSMARTTDCAKRVAEEECGVKSAMQNRTEKE